MSTISFAIDTLVRLANKLNDLSTDISGFELRQLAREISEAEEYFQHHDGMTEIHTDSMDARLALQKLINWSGSSTNDEYVDKRAKAASLTNHFVRRIQWVNERQKTQKSS